MKLILIDIDNTLLDFDAYIRQTMEEGFAHFGLRPYEPWMYDVFHREQQAVAADRGGHPDVPGAGEDPLEQRIRRAGHGLRRPDVRAVLPRRPP